MRAGMLALALGLVLPRFFFFPLPDSGYCLAVGSVLLLAPRWRVLALVVLGFAWATFQVERVMDDRLPAALDGRTFWLEGRIAGLPDDSDGVQRFELVDIRARHSGLPSRLRLAWYDGPPLNSGERWRIAARLKRAHGLLNPHGFDYEAWLTARGVGATGTVKAGRLLAAADAGRGLRDRLRQRLRDVEAHGREGAVAALVVGDGSGLSPADWRILQATGTVHLMVISGQHVGLLAGLLYAAVAGLARIGCWPRGRPWLPFACAAALGGSLGYGALAGFEVPVQRACVMVAVVLLWRLRFRQLGVTLPILLALNIVLLLDPLAALQAGFWLSFSAVALLALAFAGRLGAWAWWQSLPRAQWAMTLGLLPVLLVLGLPVSLTGPLANLIAVPWVSLISVPLALLGALALPIPALGEGLLALAGLSIAVLFDFLAALASWRPAWLPVGLPVWSWGLVALGAMTLLLPRGVPFRALGLVLLTPLLFPRIDRPDESQARVWLLDVGQGLSVLVQTHRHALLYDAGARHGDFDLGERAVVPALRGLGVAGLDRLILSHADNDHAGGARAVVAALPTTAVLSGEPERLPSELAALPCINSQHWQWDGVSFRLWRRQTAASSNAASCVLLVEAAGERLLVTGDIDSDTEALLLAESWPVEADWIVLAHHGSRSSSSAAFLKAVAPRVALVSRSRHNAFGHPHPEVVERLRQAGVSVHDTALDGAVGWTLGANGGSVRMRDEWRFWREK